MRLDKRRWWGDGALILALLVAHAGQAWAGKVTDRHGNEGYDTAAECDAAVRAGKARFYKSHTNHPPKLREGETGVKTQSLGQLIIPKHTVTSKLYGAANYALGSCDIGAPASGGRDGVSEPLQGKFIPFSAAMLVNVYVDKAGNPLRVSMKQCDNWFSHSFPRPVPPQDHQQCPPPAATAPRAVVVPDPLVPATRP
jgi:hypothetical protein